MIESTAGYTYPYDVIALSPVDFRRLFDFGGHNSMTSMICMTNTIHANHTSMCAMFDLLSFHSVRGFLQAQGSLIGNLSKSHQASALDAGRQKEHSSLASHSCFTQPHEGVKGHGSRDSVMGWRLSIFWTRQTLRDANQKTHITK